MSKFTDEAFIDAVKSSRTIREVLRKLDLAPYGGNYNVFHNRTKALNVDTSHFLGKGHNKGKTFSIASLDDYFSGKRKITSFNLKNRLLREGILLFECSICKINTWQGASISLELDHIDGDNQNNQLTNLRLLCPNCHSQTPTFRNKKREEIDITSLTM